jgi:mRNA-degrading endonuclease RelE of RelBE toxin-antitoxin system
MNWEVRFSAKAKRQAEKLPEAVRRRLKYLVEEIKVLGPVRTNWPNYGKLKGQGDCHHCHLRKGKATYVAVWRVQAEGIKLVEVRYVGTHEKADYRRIC